jgi:uncharacterized lipoprotein YmbA
VAGIGRLFGRPIGADKFLYAQPLESVTGRNIGGNRRRSHPYRPVTVVVPEYLNRNEIVVNLDNTVYRLAEFNQWAEPLNDNLTRVLEENLTNLLRGDSIDVFLASDSSIPADYRLEVDVLRLDGNLGGQVALVSQWALLETEEDGLILMRRSEYQELAADKQYKELVLAQSRMIENLSRDIAAVIKKTLGIKKK